MLLILEHCSKHDSLSAMELNDNKAGMEGLDKVRLYILTRIGFDNVNYNLNMLIDNDDKADMQGLDKVRLYISTRIGQIINDLRYGAKGGV